MRFGTPHRALLALVCLAAAVAPAPAAQASRMLLSTAALETSAVNPPPEGQIEGACGLAISPFGQVYVADYYHRLIDVFESPTATTRGGYLSQIHLPGTNAVFGVNTLDSVCGLAFDSAGNLYGNEWHEGVVRLTGGEATIDSGESTGLSIDPSTDRLYVDDRTYVAEYALPYAEGAQPLAKIGLGSLEDGYGLAAAGGRVYVADAGDQTVKVFDPTTPEAVPVATISGRFNQLTDAALAIDPTDDHLLVVDNQQPGFEHPLSSVLEFGSAGAGYPFLGPLPGAPVDGGPSGIAVAANGSAIVTDGNGELSNAFLYGAYGEGSAGPSIATESPPAASFAAPAGLAEADASNLDSHQAPGSASASEVSQSGGVRVSFQGKLAPRTLPRRGTKPVVASVGARVIPLGERTPPQLRRIEISINRNGRFAPGSVPSCRLEQIQPATTSAALAACRRALIGEGRFSARVLLPEQAPFPSSGKVYAFNGRWHGHPAIFAHVYGTEPVPVSYTIPFEMLRQHGTYGTLLRASLPEVTGNSGYITALSLTFGRGPKARGYISAGCPAPAGLNIAPFRFARVDFSFAGGRTVGSTLTRTCRTIHAG